MTITLRNCMKSSHNSFIQAAGSLLWIYLTLAFIREFGMCLNTIRLVMTDSLMTHPADEESDNVRLIELTMDKLNRDQKSRKKSLGALDYSVWKQYFTIQADHYKSDDPLLLDKLQCEYFRLFNKTFKGRKLVIGCPRLIGMIRDSLDKK